MTPRLLLLTGPAAGEVAYVFRDGCKREDGTSWLPIWDEVRDYMSAPDHVAVTMAGKRSWMRDSLPTEAEAAIRSLPGGEEWLVGLVLPEPLNSFSDEILGLTRQDQLMPARLAILAPDPSPLLVERVRAWGGEVWECFSHESGPNAGLCGINRGVGEGTIPMHPTWPEAVRAALGEVAP